MGRKENNFRETRYGRIGGPIYTRRIGVVGVDGGPARRIELADKPRTCYLDQMNKKAMPIPIRAPKTK